MPTGNIAYHLVRREDGHESLTVFLPGETPVLVNDDHPHYTAIRELVEGEAPDAEAIRDLADLSAAVAQRVDHLSERVTVGNGRVYFDGTEIDSSLTRQIVRFLDAATEDWRPLVRFWENLAANPEQHSRDQLYDWLRDRDFTITEDGQLIAYKGVRKDDDGRFVSIHAGPAIVDGEPVEGNVPNTPGSLVELDRQRVEFDPARECAFGLHVGTHEYASDWAEGATLKVKVNPRDVVSVPTDSSAAKVRVCRYRVLDVIEDEITEPVYEGGAAEYAEAELESLEGEPCDGFDKAEEELCGEPLDADGECWNEDCTNYAASPGRRNTETGGSQCE